MKSTKFKVIGTLIVLLIVASLYLLTSSHNAPVEGEAETQTEAQ